MQYLYSKSAVKNGLLQGKKPKGIFSRFIMLPAVFLGFTAFSLAGAFAGEAGTEKAASAPSRNFAEPQACGSVRLAETGWTDIAATTAITVQILQALGYETQTKLLSVPVTFNAMSTGEIDIFLGFWQPSMLADIKPYLDKGDVQLIRYNLQEARYGLAVPYYAYNAGLRNIADIARFADALGGKIYGVEPGNDGNRILLSMIDGKSDGLGGFQLVESSEQAMLSEVDAVIEDKKPIVFLAWQPHPMNEKFKLAYLAGGEAYFGTGKTGASVATIARRDYKAQCPNIGRFLQNLSFSLALENNLMDAILNKGEEPEAVARAWLKTDPPVLPEWLDGVKSRTGAGALPLVRQIFTAQ